MPPSETTEDSAARDTERVSRICANSSRISARAARPRSAPNLYTHYYKNEFPEHERLVFELHTKEAHDQASEWIAQHGIFGETGMLRGLRNLAATGRIGIGRVQSIAEKEIGPSRVPTEDHKTGTASKVRTSDFHAA